MLLLCVVIFLFVTFLAPLESAGLRVQEDPVNDSAWAALARHRWDMYLASKPKLAMHAAVLARLTPAAAPAAGVVTTVKMRTVSPAAATAAAATTGAPRARLKASGRGDR